MKKRICLFCNQNYGRPFIEVFQTFAKRNIEYDCYVFFSVKTNNNNCLKKWKHIFHVIRVTNYYGYFLEHKLHRGFTPVLVKNINEDTFMKKIPEGSYGFIAGFNQIFSTLLIKRFTSLINFHPSLLPYYRGAIPSYWVIRNNEEFSGFTAHRVVEKIDSGEIIFQEMVKIEKGISENELDEKIAKLGADYFKECLQNILDGTPFNRCTVDANYLYKVNYVSPERS